MVVAAGGIYNGRSLAASLSYGAVGAWVGTRFVASKEAGCSELHKEAVVSASFEDTLRTLVVSGRPLRVKMNDYIRSWEVDRPAEVKRLCDSGVVPLQQDIEEDKDFDIPFLMGQVAGVINKIQPAKEILEEMVAECVQVVATQQSYLNGGKSKL
jgi:NAD(P)H-dependent flavin oxidoreductase YrpB (nitropropane dioxygenase family)